MSKSPKTAFLALTTAAAIAFAAPTAEAKDGDITITNGPNATCVKIEGHPVQSAGMTCFITACRWVCKAMGSIGTQPGDPDPGHLFPGTTHIPADLWSGGSDDGDSDQGGSSGGGTAGGNGGSGGSSGGSANGGSANGGSANGGSAGGANGGSGSGSGGGHTAASGGAGTGDSSTSGTDNGRRPRFR